MNRELLAEKILLVIGPELITNGREDASELLHFWKTYIREGDPEIAIDSLIDYLQVNGIPIGTHGYQFLERFIQEIGLDVRRYLGGICIK